MLRKGVIYMAMLGMLMTGSYQWFYATVRGAIHPQPQQSIISIAPGTTLSGISRQLAEQQLLEQPLVFNVLVRLSKMEHRLRAGDYRVDTQWNYQELVDHLVHDPEVQYPVTLIEGMTLAETMRQVQQHVKIKPEYVGVKDMQVIAQALNLSHSAEGMLLPDTYFIRAGTTETALYQRAAQALHDLLAKEWSKREPGLPFKHAYEALIAASIVEKETGVAYERPLIAAAIVKRLQKGMPLQMDPTVIYGLGERFDGNLHKRDLSDPSPYNTYVHKGLPPTPIALASAESIYAVLHPANSEAIYFVAKGDGSHHFSVTLEEHNAAVRKYQLEK
jgi:UPF0755 protein